MDRLLDTATTGPQFLRLPDIADLVVAAIHEGEHRLERYYLHSYVVMPNHVHMLVTPRVTFRRWLAPLKGFTAYAANRLLSRIGQPFWQDESYDRHVRSAGEFRRIECYIEANPVKAGLASEPAEFRWSSASQSGAGNFARKPAFSRLDPLKADPRPE